MKSLRNLVGATAGIALSSALWAAPPASPVTPTPHTYTFWQGGSANLPSGQSYASAFDISLFFDPATESVATAALTLSFTGSGTRDATPLRTETVPVLNWLGNPTGLSNTYTYYADPVDSVSIRVAQRPGQTWQANDLARLYGATSAPTSTTPVYVWSQQCSGFFVVTCWPVQVHIGDNYTYDRVDGYRGAFSFSSALDTAALSEMSSTSLLRYAFSVTGGGVALESAVLTFTTAAVPEPATAALTLVGLALVIGRRLSKRRCREEVIQPRCPVFRRDFV